MLTPRLTDCIECADIPALLENIECKLTELAKKLYNNTVFSLNQPIDGTVMFDLLNYKRILTYKFCNPDYAGRFSINVIASRVKILTGNCKSNCYPYIDPITTSTTSTTTTHTTTTSTTTTHTTTTTSSTTSTTTSTTSTTTPSSTLK